MIKYINGVPGAPSAIGPYSQATIHENTVYLSGQIPVHPETGVLEMGGVEAQAERVMRNLLAVLGHLSLDFTNVLKATIFLTDLNNFAIVNNVYSKWMGEVRPARACVEVAALPKGAEVEIEMIAALTTADILEVPHDSVEDELELASEMNTN